MNKSLIQDFVNAVTKHRVIEYILYKHINLYECMDDWKNIHMYTHTHTNAIYAIWQSSANSHLMIHG